MSGVLARRWDEGLDPDGAGGGTIHGTNGSSPEESLTLSWNNDPPASLAAGPAMGVPLWHCVAPVAANVGVATLSMVTGTVEWRGVVRRGGRPHGWGGDEDDGDGVAAS